MIRSTIVAGAMFGLTAVVVFDLFCGKSLQVMVESVMLAGAIGFLIPTEES